MGESPGRHLLPSYGHGSAAIADAHIFTVHSVVTDRVSVDVNPWSCLSCQVALSWESLWVEVPPPTSHLEISRVPGWVSEIDLLQIGQLNLVWEKQPGWGAEGSVPTRTAVLPTQSLGSGIGFEFLGVKIPQTD